MIARGASVGRRNDLARIVLAGMVLCTALSGCAGWPRDDLSAINFRGEMRTFVEEIANYARISNPEFVVIPQNGHELLTVDGEASGAAALSYVAAISAVGREDLFYGYEADDKATPAADTARIVAYMDRALTLGLEVLAIDYCETPDFVDDSYLQSETRGYISFAADHRELDNIPGYPAGGYASHTGAIAALADARNFLYLINPGQYPVTADFLNAIDATDYDLFVIDLFSDANLQLGADDIAALQTKPGGGRRFVVAYMSIGEAEDYRYYWDDSWKRGSPEWLEAENLRWRGNFVVRYWDPEWKSIVFGSSGAYLDRIIAAGFDGVYLDIIDGYEYFEERYE